MAKNQKHYTPEFKQQIVDLYHAGGTSYPQLERNFEAENVNQKMVHRYYLYPCFGGNLFAHIPRLKRGPDYLIGMDSQNIRNMMRVGTKTETVKNKNMPETECAR